MYHLETTFDGRWPVPSRFFFFVIYKGTDKSAGRAALIERSPRVNKSRRHSPVKSFQFAAAVAHCWVIPSTIWTQISVQFRSTSIKLIYYRRKKREMLSWYCITKLPFLLLLHLGLSKRLSLGQWCLVGVINRHHFLWFCVLEADSLHFTPRYRLSAINISIYSVLADKEWEDQRVRWEFFKQFWRE